MLEEVLSDQELTALERIATAFEKIADTLTALYNREYPTRLRKEANVTHKLTDEEILERKISGDPNEPLEWIGEREREVISLESSERAGAESKKN